MNINIQQIANRGAVRKFLRYLVYKVGLLLQLRLRHTTSATQMTESIKQWASTIGFGREFQAAALTKAIEEA
jgi:hypothetical protein